MGYEQVDSVKEDKSTHGIFVYRKVPITRAGGSGTKTNQIFLSDQLLENSGYDRSAIIDAYTQQLEIIVETIQNGRFTEIVSVMIV